MKILTGLYPFERTALPSHNLLQAPSAVKDVYGRWFDDRINEFVSQHKGRFEPASMFKHQNGFFITVSFDQNLPLNEGSSSSKSELQLFSDLYNRICRIVVGRNFHRQSHQSSLPLAIAGLDANGSRYWRAMGALENLHIHSIWILPPQSIDKFRELLADETQLSSLKVRLGIRALDIQPLDHDRQTTSDVSRVSSYTAKFIAHNNQGLAISDDIRMFPLQDRQTH